jgi:hypothetical protein
MASSSVPLAIASLRPALIDGLTGGGRGVVWGCEGDDGNLRGVSQGRHAFLSFAPRCAASCPTPPLLRFSHMIGGLPLFYGKKRDGEVEQSRSVLDDRNIVWSSLLLAWVVSQGVRMVVRRIDVDPIC